MKLYNAIKVIVDFNKDAKDEVKIDAFAFAYDSKELLHKHLLAEGFEYRNEEWSYILTGPNGYRLAKIVELSVVIQGGAGK